MIPEQLAHRIATHVGELQALAGSGGEADIRALIELNKALREMAAQSNEIMKGALGTIQQGAAFSSSSGSELAPLIPQSIQSTMDLATFDMDHLVFTGVLRDQGCFDDITSTLHENVLLEQYGQEWVTPFFDEGGRPSDSEMKVSRQIAKIKYLGEGISVTDPSMLVNAIGFGGVNRGVLNTRTEAGTRSLASKMEWEFLFGSEECNALGFDGLAAGALGYTGVKQLPATAADQWSDLRNQPISGQLLVEQVKNLIAAPYYARPTHILAGPEVYATLNNEMTQFGRKAITGGDDSPFVYGHSGVSIRTNKGVVPVIEVPFLDERMSPPTASAGDAPPAALSHSDVTVTVSADADSRFTATDAGAYNFKIMAVGDKGQLLPLHTNGTTAGTVSITAGDGVQFDIADAARPTSGANSIRFYVLFRSEKDGSVSTCKRCWMFPRNTSGASGGTRIVDVNFWTPGGSHVFIGEFTKRVMSVNKLLDLTRVPLAKLETRQPFLLIQFLNFHMRQSNKVRSLLNASKVR